MTFTNFSDEFLRNLLTDYAALLRAGMYLAGKKEEAEDNGFRFKVTESERHGVVVKIAEVDK